MIKNSNDMLGFLIKNKNSNNEVLSSFILENAGMDGYSANCLLLQLKEQHFIIYAYDIISLTELGLRNYVSPLRRFSLWLAKLLILTIKNLLMYIAGIVSGVLIAYFSNMFIR